MENKWINLNESLPEEGDIVIVATKQIVSTAIFFGGKFNVLPMITLPKEVDQENVTHWMYYPKNPNKRS